VGEYEVNKGANMEANTQKRIMHKLMVAVLLQNIMEKASLILVLTPFMCIVDVSENTVTVLF
jgi:hypothetical protein